MRPSTIEDGIYKDILGGFCHSLQLGLQMLFPAA
jgi:hypothetical protein